MYENGGQGFSYNVGFYHCAISIYANSFKSYIIWTSNSAAYMELCNLYVENTNSNKYTWFNIWGKEADCYFKNSLLTLKGDIGKSNGNSLLFIRDGYNNSNYLVMKDCLIEGRLYGVTNSNFLDGGNGSKSATTGCVYNIDLTENTFSKIGNDNSGTVNIVNKDLLPAGMTLSDKYQLVSSEDILIPSLNASLGFPVSEVV